MPHASAAGTVTRDDVLAAAARLSSRIRTTPMADLPPGPNGELISLKLEFMQLSGSFKLRGATNRIAMDEGRHQRVTAVSGGNHGAAVAYASRLFGLIADIFLPSYSPAHKLKLIEEQGATAHLIDGTFSDSVAACTAFTAENDALGVHPFDDPGTIAGQGSLGLEILQQRPDTAKIVAAVGGGGLAAGIAAGVDGAADIVAAEPVECPCLAEALKAGEPTTAPVGGIAADALGAPVIGEIAFSILAPVLKRLVCVPEEAILRAQRQIWADLRLCIEPAAACAWAAAQADGVLVPGQRTVIILCGANIDPRAWNSLAA